MKKCDCFNQHDKEIRDTLNLLKELIDSSRTRLNNVVKYHERSIREYNEDPLVGIFMGIGIIAAIFIVVAIILRLVR